MKSDSVCSTLNTRDRMVCFFPSFHATGLSSTRNSTEKRDRIADVKSSYAMEKLLFFEQGMHISASGEIHSKV